MKWSHLLATLWLRWRILANRIRRTSKWSTALFGLLILIGVSISVGLFVVGLTVGLETLPDAEPRDVMLVWVVLALAFLFFWMIGLVTDLQRSDAMSFKNLLHLPVSLGWVFLYNYVSSWVSISIALFLPAMIGLCLAMVIVHGPLMLLGLPLVLGFMWMITALTYQLRGWLARLMEDKRRGRSIVAVITVGFVLLPQLPNLINLGMARSRRAALEQERLEITTEDRESGDPLARYREEKEQEKARVDRYVSLGARIIPLGWLPYGVRATFEGSWPRGGLCVLGMLAIGAWSLRRSYRKTLASFVGSGSGAESAAVAGPAPETATGLRVERRTLLVERRLPMAGEGPTGIALACLRSLLRAPEAKLLLLSPVLLLGIFGFMLATNPALDHMRPFAPMMGLGAIALGLLSINQLIQNQFGLDRAGFRAYVLSPVPRQHVLLGKNLATAPLGLGIGFVCLVGLQFFVPADFFHFLSACLALVSAYLILCLVGNTMSICFPMRLRENGLKAANANLKTILSQVFSIFLIPLALLPLMIPSGVELLLRGQDWARAIPIHFILHAAGVIGVVFLYRWMIRHQGELLQEREQRILDTLTHE